MGGILTLALSRAGLKDFFSAAYRITRDASRVMATDPRAFDARSGPAQNDLAMATDRYQQFDYMKEGNTGADAKRSRQNEWKNDGMNTREKTTGEPDGEGASQEKQVVSREV